MNQVESLLAIADNQYSDAYSYAVEAAERELSRISPIHKRFIERQGFSATKTIKISEPLEALKGRVFTMKELIRNPLLDQNKGKLGQNFLHLNRLHERMKHPQEMIWRLHRLSVQSMGAYRQMLTTEEAFPNTRRARRLISRPTKTERRLTALLNGALETGVLEDVSAYRKVHMKFCESPETKLLLTQASGSFPEVQRRILLAEDLEMELDFLLLLELGEDFDQ